MAVWMYKVWPILRSTQNKEGTDFSVEASAASGSLWGAQLTTDVVNHHLKLRKVPRCLSNLFQWVPECLLRELWRLGLKNIIKPIIHKYMDVTSHELSPGIHQRHERARSSHSTSLWWPKKHGRIISKFISVFRKKLQMAHCLQFLNDFFDGLY